MESLCALSFYEASNYFFYELEHLFLKIVLKQNDTNKKNLKNARAPLLMTSVVKAMIPCQDPPPGQ